jgi:hypothetical protein
MPLSRLENFLKNAEGNILYVNPSDFDATDSYENRGNSLTRPFRTIQRALIEAARFSYQVGKSNDLIDRTTILVYPGTHYIDNRPGYSITNQSGSGQIKQLINGSWTTTGATLSEFNENSNFDIFDENNDLRKYNSVYGGIILPRGTSIVGLDLRKTKIRPLYVPDPLNDAIDRSAIFRVTGTCYFTAFSIFDADLNRAAYKDSTALKVVPNFSHHKLTVFEYADGVNLVNLGSEQTSLTDLDMYYYKVTYAYGETSGRSLPNYPNPTGVDDFEKSVDEYRIVGDLRSDAIGISSIKSGDGNIPTSTITVTTTNPHGLYKDTPFLITGITTNINSYTGSLVVSNVTSTTEFQYTAPETPTNALPDSSQILNGSVTVESDTVTSASPYIFSCTLRSVYGMNGMFADGNKATGFKSMLVAQFTGISLQKDDNSFILYDDVSGVYNSNLTVSDSQKPLHINSSAIYRPGWESTHMRVSNNSIFQCVSVFAIGFARHFVAETGGDMSITNSNSNFGALSLESNGFRPESFDRDDVGYITHIIPPREPDEKITNVSWISIDTTNTISVAKTERLYIYGYNNIDTPPATIIDGYRIGAKQGELLYLPITNGAEQNIYSAPVLMPGSTGAGVTSSQKVYVLGRSQSGINSITNNILSVNGTHELINGEKIRIYSDTGSMPANISPDKIYYAITNSLPSNQLKLAPSLNDALVGNSVNGISNGGGVLRIVSSVSDKDAGDLGHPIQYDTSVKQWYLNVSKVTLYNTIYGAITGLGTASLGAQTPATYITRKIDTRSLDEKLYKIRYVIPKEFTKARPPSDGFVFQESKSVGIGSVSFVNSNISDNTQLRNPKIIVKASYDAGSQSVTIKTELPHNLVVGDTVIISNVKSTNNTGIATLFNSIPYNGTYQVAYVISPRSFIYSGIATDPGTFISQTNQRATQQQLNDLPTVKRTKYKDSTYIYRSQEIKKLIPGATGQDGIYNIIPICGSISPPPTVGFGISSRRFAQDIRNLYPQFDRDNFVSDPQESTTFANLYPVGRVNTNDKKKSITKEALNYFFQNNQIGYAITGATISGVGNTTMILYTDTPHNLNSIRSIQLIGGGNGYNNAAGVSSTLYSADLESNYLVGNYASVKATVSAGNTISAISLVDGGSAYGVGNTMRVSAYPAGAPNSYALAQVTAINSAINGTLELCGFYEPLHNGAFKILSVPDPKTIVIYNPNGIGAGYTQRTDYRLPQAYFSSNSVGLSTMQFTKQSGIATVTTLNSHGLQPGNVFFFVGLSTLSTYFNKRFQVSEVVGLTTFTFSAGITTTSQTIIVNGATLHKPGFSANGKAYGIGEGNLGGRGSYIYAGITTTLASDITSTTTTIQLTNSDGFRKGDYLLIGSEILRVASDPNANSFFATRGQFATVAVAAVANSLVRKIRVLPMEIRRHSILRASGHTFEYMGYGPGNYSTGFPIKQNRILTDDEVLVSQARQQDGGTVVYTGMNDRGEFYNGAKKVNGATGEETVIAAPVVTTFGEDLAENLSNKSSGVFDDLLVTNRLTVEGGENNNQTSQFYGPVNFSSRVTSTSEDGLEVKQFYIRGNAAQPKFITVGISTPTNVTKSGDVSFLSTPNPGDYMGHIYANGDWRRWGMISQERDRDFLTLDQIGIGQTTSIYNFTDALEVNGTVKVKNLYVGGAVTFAGAQAIGQAEFDNLTINKTITYVGQSTTHTIRTTNANTIAQFQNVEVTGAAVTFGGSVVGTGSGPKFKIQNEFVSEYTGVSTFLGQLKVYDLVIVQDFFKAGIITANYTNINTLGIITEAFIPSGIITAARSKYIGGFGNAGSGQTSFQICANSGIITSLSSGVSTITTLNSTNSYINKGRVEELITPSLLATVGLVTSLVGTSVTYSYSRVGVETVTNGIYANTVYTPNAYINSGIITSLTCTYLNVPSGGIATLTSLTTPDLNSDTAVFGNARVTSHLVVDGTGTDEGLYANVGMITQFGNGTANMYVTCGASGIVTASYFKSTAAQGTAPLIVNSTTKVTNLNADLLDGLNTSSTDQTTASVVVRSQDGNFRAGVITCTTLYGNIVGSVTPPSNGYLSVGNAYVSSGGDAAVFSTYIYTTNGGTSYTAATQTVGGVYKISGQTHNWYTHNGSVTPVLTTVLTLASTGDLTATGYVQANSDLKLKTNIKTIDNALDKVCKLRGVEFDRIDIEGNPRQIGVIAQEIEEVFPELVSTNDEGTKSVAYGNLVGALIESIKELKMEINDLKSEIAELKAK